MPPIPSTSTRPAQGSNLNRRRRTTPARSSLHLPSSAALLAVHYGAVQRQDSDGNWSGPARSCSPGATRHSAASSSCGTSPASARTTGRTPTSTGNDRRRQRAVACGQPRPPRRARTGSMRGSPTDVFGSDRDQEAENYFTVDSIEPQTSITSGRARSSAPARRRSTSPSAATIRTRPTFDRTRTLDPADATYPGGNGSGHRLLRLPPRRRCRGITAPPPEARPPTRYSIPPTEGAHTLEVRAIDKASNHDVTPASHSWIVDLTPPEITIDEPTRGGYLLHDGPERGPDFDVHRPASPAAPPAPPGSPPAPTTAINDEDLGPHSFTVTATDKAGNTSTKSVAYVIDPPSYGDFVETTTRSPTTASTRPLGSDGRCSTPPATATTAPTRTTSPLQRAGAITCERRPHPPRACELAADPENKAAYFPRPRRLRLRQRDHRPDHRLHDGGLGQAARRQRTDGHEPRRRRPALHPDGGTSPSARPRTRSTTPARRLRRPRASGPTSPRPGTATTTRLYVNGDPGRPPRPPPTSRPRAPRPSTSATARRRPGSTATIDEAAYYDHALTSTTSTTATRSAPPRTSPRSSAGNQPVQHRGPVHRPGRAEEQRPLRAGQGPRRRLRCTDPDDGSRRQLRHRQLHGDGRRQPDRTTATRCPTRSASTPSPSPPIDKGGNTYVHTHTYDGRRSPTSTGRDNPVAYYRLGDGRRHDDGRRLRQRPPRRIQERPGLGPGRDLRRRRHAPASSSAPTATATPTASPRRASRRRSRPGSTPTT